MILVVDASVILDLLLQAPTAPIIEGHVFAAETLLAAPELLHLETVQVLRRWRHRGWMSSERADLAIHDFRALNIKFYSHGLFLERCWDLKDRLTAYDASYLALAELLNAKVLTKDVSFLGVSSTVEVVWLSPA